MSNHGSFLWNSKVMFFILQKLRFCCNFWLFEREHQKLLSVIVKNLSSVMVYSQTCGKKNIICDGWNYGERHKKSYNLSSIMLIFCARKVEKLSSVMLRFRKKRFKKSWYLSSVLVKFKIIEVVTVMLSSVILRFCGSKQKKLSSVMLVFSLSDRKKL